MLPILRNKDASAPSVFRPEALLREARRQKGLPVIDVPSVCILDPDGDIVRLLRQDGRARPFEGWPCYHTGLDANLAGGPSASSAVSSARRSPSLSRRNSLPVAASSF